MQELQKSWVQSLGWEDPLEKEMATHSSIPAGIIPWTEKPDGLQSMGLQRVGYDWAHTHTLEKYIINYFYSNLFQISLKSTFCSCTGPSSQISSFILTWVSAVLPTQPPFPSHLLQTFTILSSQLSHPTSFTLRKPPASSTKSWNSCNTLPSQQLHFPFSSS